MQQVGRGGVSSSSPPFPFIIMKLSNKALPLQSRSNTRKLFKWERRGLSPARELRTGKHACNTGTKYGINKPS